ncbi:hypothetical protein BDY24DRAFT_345368 [Mrakia frigida]|uniref:uncharacterized protein n=1 Tax=Mrakia frigida TaxID=29902 RepID=UPI003FCBF749
MEKEREQEQLSLRDSEASSAEERKAWEEEKTELQTKVEELRQTAERLADAAASSSSGYAGAGFGDSAGLLSPTASLATSLMRNKGQSLSDIYVENVKLKNDLGRQEEETKRLEQCLGQVMKDIQERAPVFKQQREEYFHIRDVANDQANQIVVLTTERTTQDQLNSRLHSKLKHAESTVHELERYNSDVSRQKLSLARQLAVRDDPSLVEQLEDEDQFAGDDAQNIVSRSLVTYKSIPELISKNEELVRLTRRLADQMEATQASGGGGANQQYDAAEVELAVEEAQTMNQSLQSKLEEKEVQLLKYVRERDMFSRMLSQAGIVLPVGQRLDEVAGGAGTENVIAVMKQNMEELRKELGLDAERLRGELVEVRKELGGASGRLARVESERDYLKGASRFSLLRLTRRRIELTVEPLCIRSTEQLTNQKERNELQQVEFNGLTKQTQLLKDDVNRLNVNLRNVSSQASSFHSIPRRALY